MHPFLWLGIALVALWLLVVVVFKVVGFAFHLLLLAAVVFIIWGLVKRGARKIGIGGDRVNRR
ncbi:hypothetical protein [Longimicrobium terrae]|uniref:UPF0716 family protein affecting phage T7 exclusion n=1 Tax=Longimicrobium terrae TaxID=1639882 RepID=A0A841H3B5_9BACT|nr:hypothetical protein [Longimicrobium terrae]MBB4638086.1 UPF0716 family protein affecting phage T7 exclusion [Longimicrobium terrae]MBB6072458.1 UPF0716 family protein affecting phage T7 exclusion [Longimicrobium terrae]NNC32130.1 hypothetical protein [Longimicrobium terrae]